MKLQCPACGAEIKFKSRSSVFGVCSYCNSTLVRHDLNLETLGKMSEMPQDLSPLQVGTSGVYEGSKFEIIGRQRIGWSEGYWNEWYVLFDNGKDGWLADAQGFYMMSFECRESLQLPARATMSVDKQVVIKGRSYVVDDIKEVSCVASEGELSVKSVHGRKSTSVDLTGPSKEFGNIDYADDETRVFLGRYLEFEEFKFMNLREIDGW